MDQAEVIAHDPETQEALAFIKNQKMLDVVNGEEIGSIKKLHRTKSSESVAEGEGLKEGIVARTKHSNKLMLLNHR